MLYLKGQNTLIKSIEHEREGKIQRKVREGEGGGD